MIAIIDYDMGNLRSLENALDRLGAQYQVTADPLCIRRADRVILPGVGHAGAAVDKLTERGLFSVIRSLRQPVLGICVGMQVLCRDSEEAPGKSCLGVFDTHVRPFRPAPGCKVPHMGWNQIGNMESRLLREVDPAPYVYFVHSYYADLCPDTVATCRYGDTLFSAVLKYENFYGTQFHPEKSSAPGARILQNFLSL